MYLERERYHSFWNSSASWISWKSKNWKNCNITVAIRRTVYCLRSHYSHTALPLWRSFPQSVLGGGLLSLRALLYYSIEYNNFSKIPQIPTPQDPSFQTVLTWRHQRLCIFGLYGAIRMLLLFIIIINRAPNNACFAIVQSIVKIQSS